MSAHFQNLTADDDLSALLALNNKFEALASRLDAQKLQGLVGMAFTTLATPDQSAFLIALDQDAPYRNVNFAWFTARYPRFVYIDRIMVDADAQGSGAAAQMYDALFDRARAAGHTLAACEVNSVPPNPRSERFHARMGFAEAGQAQIPGRTVRYLTKFL